MITRMLFVREDCNKQSCWLLLQEDARCAGWTGWAVFASDNYYLLRVGGNITDIYCLPGQEHQENGTVYVYSISI